MNQEKRRCPSDYSLEELEELEVELKRRRRTETNPSFALVIQTPKVLDKATTRTILEEQCFVFRGIHEERGYSFSLDSAMGLLRLHPLLVAEPFGRRSVLSYLLVANAPLSVIKEFCGMWKAAKTTDEIQKLWKEEGYDNGPNFVADACLYSSQADSLELLLKEFPEQAEMNDPWSRSPPLQLFLDRCDKFDDDLDELDFDYEPCPTDKNAAQMYQIMKDSSHTKPRPIEPEWVVRGDYGDGVSGVLAKQLFADGVIRKLKFLDCLDFREWDGKSIERCKLLLPKLKSFEMADFTVGYDLYHLMLKMFSEVKPTVLTHLKLPVLCQFLHDESNQQLFINAMQSCPNLETLDLVPTQHDLSSSVPMDGEVLCNLCKDILLWTKSLKSLLVTVPKSTDGSSLSTLVHSAVVKVESFSLNVGSTHQRSDDSLLSFEVPANSKLQNLALDCSIGTISTKCILGQLTDMPTLTGLSIHGRTNGVHFDDQIAAILAQNHLEELSIKRGVFVILDALADVLKENTSLKTLRCHHGHDVEKVQRFVKMMEGNFTLEHVELNCTMHHPILTQISYWTKLNKCGRAKLGEPDAPVGSVVCALKTAAQEFPEGNLWYELLRVNPGPWAGAALAMLSQRA